MSKASTDSRKMLSQGARGQSNAQLPSGVGRCSVTVRQDGCYRLLPALGEQTNRKESLFGSVLARELRDRQ